MSNKSKNILSGGPEGTINSKQINNIPDAEDDVEGHGKHGKNILSGGPEGTINSKQINNIPDAEDDVEGHSIAAKNSL